MLDFEISTDETDIKISAEHTEYKWVGIKEIGKLYMKDGHKESIKKVLKNK